MQFEDVKTTIKEHPVETVAVVTAVGLLGVIFYQNRKKKALERELAMYRTMDLRLPRDPSLRHQSQYVLKLVS